MLRRIDQVSSLARQLSLKGWVNNLIGQFISIQILTHQSNLDCLVFLAFELLVFGCWQVVDRFNKHLYCPLTTIPLVITNFVSKGIRGIRLAKVVFFGSINDHSTIALFNCSILGAAYRGQCNLIFVRITIIGQQVYFLAQTIFLQANRIRFSNRWLIPNHGYGYGGG